ncbi:MAG TPA: hypothetical protein PK079_26450 [Leptospiraceae bacterium]|nr:hypothetical protein [Leptospiraceae bacterium]HMZ67617.1 hypothetical protein [Leptospiraceae bacterium]HNA10407.1 hypothetical protein [Leptospiraceae bacterium]HNC59830.1 hypothetical protein [Leptospiraceae bacterium]HNE56732.1 hypothetical protein [Leptospiraceae bacterium]
MEKELDVFQAVDGRIQFEDYGKENGMTYWFARDLMTYLEYEDFSAFRIVISKAMTTCHTLNIDTIDDFRQVEREIDGKKVTDFKLSRFACFLISMNADPKKKNVAKAQIYFTKIASLFEDSKELSKSVERLLVRDEISQKEKVISGLAHAQGVMNYPLFQNAGYRGLYNKNLKDLKEYKGMEDFNKSLLDFMGSEELAANLFRITQTTLKIKNENIKGQRNLENVAETVGHKVRKSMIEISGIKPEDLPLTSDIKETKKVLKQANQKFKKIKKK